MFNIYRQFSSTGDYSVPGPPLYSGASEAGGVAPSGTSGASAPVPSSPGGGNPSAGSSNSNIQGSPWSSSIDNILDN
jgi:hypothetical protein